MRSKNVFHFKQFSIRQDRVTMKVGTDGVLLGAWVTVPDAGAILDIGTGSGVIAIMLAQRTNESVKIDAVEIVPQDAEQARENVASAPWKQRIAVHTMSIQQYQPATKYDLIVCNPPYFINSLTPPDPGRKTARHASSLTQNDLLLAAKSLLTTHGRLSVILPYTEGNLFMHLAASSDLHCIRQAQFKTRKNKPVERLLLEFSFVNQPLATEEIVLYEEREEYTAQYRHLTGAFYLHF